MDFSRHLFTKVQNIVESEARIRLKVKEHKNIKYYTSWAAIMSASENLVGSFCKNLVPSVIK